MQGSTNTAPVSVLIPCYCCTETIERAVRSVVAQTLLPAEVWLIDDGSPDEGRTLETLNTLQQRYGDQTRVEVLSFTENRGLAAARNAGWDAATQPYIALLDADDA